MRTPTDKQINVLVDYLTDLCNMDEDWIKDHISITTEKTTSTVTIEIWDMDEQDFKDFE